MNRIIAIKLQNLERMLSKLNSVRHVSKSARVEATKKGPNPATCNPSGEKQEDKKKETAAKPPPKADVIKPGYLKLKEIQAKFQVDDGLPVFLKGGPRDKILYQATLALTAIGMIWVVCFLVCLALPHK